MKTKNIFKEIPSTFKKEIFENILLTENFKLERILSKGHVTPPNEWYNQDQNEWVLLLKGSADLQIEGKKDWVHLAAGDYILIPAHVKHRVEWTQKTEETIWLALHF